jgi:hypothetical protein
MRFAEELSWPISRIESDSSRFSRIGILAAIRHVDSHRSEVHVSTRPVVHLLQQSGIVIGSISTVPSANDASFSRAHFIRRILGRSTISRKANMVEKIGQSWCAWVAKAVPQDSLI